MRKIKLILLFLSTILLLTTTLFAWSITVEDAENGGQLDVSWNTPSGWYFDALSEEWTYVFANIYDIDVDGSFLDDTESTYNNSITGLKNGQTYRIDVYPYYYDYWQDEYYELFEDTNNDEQIYATSYGTPTDKIAPNAPTVLIHSDQDKDSKNDGVDPQPGFDDDNSLYFYWTSGSDPSDTDDGYVKYEIDYKKNGIQQPSFYTEKTFTTFTANSGEYFDVEVRSVDNDGNTSQNYASERTIYCDSSSPTNISITNKEDAVYTEDGPEVDLMLSAEDNLKEQGLRMRFSEDNINWIDYGEFQDIYKYKDFSSGPGSKDVYFQVVDKAGNVSGSAYFGLVIETGILELSIVDNDTGDDIDGALGKVLGPSILLSMLNNYTCNLSEASHIIEASATGYDKNTQSFYIKAGYLNKKEIRLTRKIVELQGSTVSSVIYMGENMPICSNIKVSLMNDTKDFYSSIDDGNFRLDLYENEMYTIDFFAEGHSTQTIIVDTNYLEFKKIVMPRLPSTSNMCNFLGKAPSGTTLAIAKDGIAQTEVVANNIGVYSCFVPNNNTYSVTAIKDGYAATSFSLDVLEEDFKRKDFNMDLLFTLTGIVLSSETLQPISNATVRFGDVVANTNVQGEYSVSIGAGDYEVTCDASEYKHFSVNKYVDSNIGVFNISLVSAYTLTKIPSNTVILDGVSFKHSLRLFRDRNYNGDFWDVESDRNSIDEITSIKIYDQATQAVGYRDTNYLGEKVLIKNDIDFNYDSNWNDCMSSIKIGIQDSPVFQAQNKLELKNTIDLDTNNTFNSNNEIILLPGLVIEPKGQQILKAKTQIHFKAELGKPVRVKHGSILRATIE